MFNEKAKSGKLIPSGKAIGKIIRRWVGSVNAPSNEMTTVPELRASAPEPKCTTIIQIDPIAQECLRFMGLGLKDGLYLFKKETDDAEPVMYWDPEELDHITLIQIQPEWPNGVSNNADEVTALRFSVTYTDGSVKRWRRENLGSSIEETEII